MELSEDGSWLLSRRECSRHHHAHQECRVCQVANPSNELTLREGSGVRVAFSPDCRKFAIDDEKGRLYFRVSDWFNVHEEMQRDTSRDIHMAGINRGLGVNVCMK